MTAKWNWKAILGLLAARYFVGLIVGWCVLLAVNIALWSLRLIHGPLDYKNSMPHLIAFTVAGAILNLCYGYLIAAWAPSRKMEHTAGLAILSFGLLLVLTWTGHYRSDHLWFSVARALVMGLMFLGARWRIETHGEVTTPVMKSKTRRDAAPIASPFGD